MLKRKHSDTIDSKEDIKPIKCSKFSIDNILSNEASSSSVEIPLLPINNFVPISKPPSPTSLTDPSSEETEEELDCIKSEALHTDSPFDESATTPTPSVSDVIASIGAPQFVNWPPAGNSTKLSQVQVYLEQRELWTSFSELGTEMIITKSGRRMFPVMKIRLEGCDPEFVYYVYLDIIPVDDRRYRYVYNKSSWLVAGKAEPPSPSRLYMHPDCPFQGRSLSTQSQVISFEKAKLTNHEAGPTGHLVLNSMHKYQPRIHIVIRDKSNLLKKSEMEMPNLQDEEYKTFLFTETQFMAVTAYQNQLVTKLKIEKNPFAKGFRDTNARSDSNEMHSSMNRILPFSAAAPFYFQQAQAFIQPPIQPNEMLLQTMPHLNMALNIAAIQQQMAMAQGFPGVLSGAPRLQFDPANFLTQNGNKKVLMNFQNGMKKLTDCQSQ